MSTTDFKNMYVVSVILVLLFGVGVGYQINTWVTDESASTSVADESASSQNGTEVSSSPRAIPEIYSRTGQVESVSPDSITFITILQNSDSSYSKSTLIASLSDSTTFTKIYLSDTSKGAEDISQDTIAVGSEVAISSAENIYGKTKFTATSVQLHQF